MYLTFNAISMPTSADNDLVLLQGDELISKMVDRAKTFSTRHVKVECPPSRRCRVERCESNIAVWSCLITSCEEAGAQKNQGHWQA